MGIVLNVLFWIGIILLVILGITLLLVVIVLLSPIYYQADARGDIEDGSLVADLRLTWLGLAFGFYGHYDRLSGKPASQSVRILGIDPYEWRRKRAEKKRKRARAAKKRRLEKLKKTNPEEYNRLKEKARAKKSGEETAGAAPATPSGTIGADSGAAESAYGTAGSGGSAATTSSGPTVSGSDAIDSTSGLTATSSDSPRPGDATADNISDEDEQILDEDDWDEPASGHGVPFISWFLELVLKIISKIQGACGTIGTWNEFRKDPSTRKAIHIMIYHIIRILKHSFPRISGRLAFGFTDPSITGKLLALASMFYPLWAEKLVLQPDFSEFLLNGDIHISGRIRPGTVGWHVIMTMLRKEVRETIKTFRSR